MTATDIAFDLDKLMARRSVRRCRPSRVEAFRLLLRRLGLE